MTEALKFIFSAIVLTAIAIIVTGIMLGKIINLRANEKNKFRVKVPYVLSIEASGGDLVLGFGAFLITMLMTALCAGHWARPIVSWCLGLDEPQFRCVCYLSSFTTVTLTFALLILTTVVFRGKIVSVPNNDDIIAKVSRSTE